MAMEEDRKELGVDQKKEEEKWVTHYSSKHRILLVGEGDFSFSLSLASSFGSAFNICATSLDSEDDVINKYENAKSNLEILKKLGASILHGVDATKMKNLGALKRRKFDRIIFNFPHSGFHGNEGDDRVIQNHKTLVRGFFSNARRMLQVKGEIHVNHKTTPPFCYWNLEELASENSLELIVSVEFKIGDYPGYNNKRGAGPKCDEPFPLDYCDTYKFRFFDRAKNMSRQFQDSPAQMQLLQPNTSGFNYNQRKHIAAVNPFPLQPQLPSAIQAGLLPRCHATKVNHIPELASTICAGRDIEYRSQAGLQHTFRDFSWPQRDRITDMNHNQPHVGLLSTINAGNVHSWVFGGNLNDRMEAYPRPSYNVQCSTVERLRYNFDVPYSLPAGVKHDFGRQKVELQKRTSREDAYLKHENHMNIPSSKRPRVLRL